MCGSILNEVPMSLQTKPDTGEKQSITARSFRSPFGQPSGFAYGAPERTRVSVSLELVAHFDTHQATRAWRDE